VSREGGYRVLLIDLDGTVVDYAQTEANALTAIHGAFFRRYVPLPAFRAAFHARNDELWATYRRHQIDLDCLRTLRFARLLTDLGVPHKPGAAPEIAARFEHELGRAVVLFEDALPALRALARVCCLVLVTDGIAEVQHAKLGRARLRSFFRAVVISSEVGYRKPDPALLLRALAQVDADRGTALMVGDSPVSDGVGARAAGIDFCWVNRAELRDPAGPPRPAGEPGLSACFEVPDLTALARIMIAVDSQRTGLKTHRDQRTGRGLARTG